MSELDHAALSRLLAAIGGDIEDFEELCAEFLETTPATLAVLQDAAASGDLTSLRINAHALKGNARDFGATQLALDCATLEARAKSGAPFDASSPVAEIAKGLAEARAALAALDARSLA